MISLFLHEIYRALPRDFVRRKILNRVVDKVSIVRIISLAPSNTEILYEIGAEEDVVATTSLCDYPEEATEKPGIGGWINPKIEEIQKFGPDLVLASDDLQDEAVRRMEEQDYEVLQVRPHTVEEVFESLIEIGEAVGRKERAEELVEDMRDSIENLEFNDSPRIYCEEWMNPPMASGNWIPGLIDRTDGKFFLEEGERSREFDLEKLKDFDPEYIFLNVCGAGENVDRSEILERREWQNIAAVKEEKVFVLDDSLLNRPGPRLLEGLNEMIRKVEEN